MWQANLESHKVKLGDGLGCRHYHSISPLFYHFFTAKQPLLNQPPPAYGAPPPGYGGPPPPPPGYAAAPPPPLVPNQQVLPCIPLLSDVI